MNRMEEIAMKGFVDEITKVSVAKGLLTGAKKFVTGIGAGLKKGKVSYKQSLRAQKEKSRLQALRAGFKRVGKELTPAQMAAAGGAAAAGTLGTAYVAKKMTVG